MGKMNPQKYNKMQTVYIFLVMYCKSILDTLHGMIYLFKHSGYELPGFVQYV